MSWSKSYDSLSAFEDDTPTNSLNQEVESDFQDHIDLARKLIKEAIDSGSLGGENKDFTIYMGGHSNPNHEPKAKWSNDFISIQINQKSDA